MAFDALPRFAKRAYRDAKGRADEKGLPLLSKHEFAEIWDRCSGQCELSGLAFSSEPEEVSSEAGFTRQKSYPWEPSLDQIRPGLGYALENCQLVCKAVNIGKNSYSQETFLKWVTAVAKTQSQMGDSEKAHGLRHRVDASFA